MEFEVDVRRMELRGRPVLRDIRFSVAAGERVVLLGVNGSGKTTLLKLMDGLAFPQEGAVRWRGRALDAAALAGAAFRRAFRGEVGLLFQNVDAMLFNPSVADEIAFGPRQLGVPEPEVEARVARWAGAFGLEALRERPPFELSGGEKKRVAMAALMAVGPKVLLLDEPTAGLDPASAGRLVDFLAGLEGTTVVTSTHHLTLAEELGTRAVLLGPERAGVLHDGPTAALVRDERALVESGLAHRHAHAHGAEVHAHFHVHDTE
ncbi:energy-coupling factor ABC transporter ATP-binding protein [Anaeromyxobacter sp. PSR-1]|uniref:energy-coupling factor ABC transporter ATP-binding protein n=1 Tax=Anaeromyxobacter sp. PSR-1 TaxID=1300915 RepID=UPI0005E58B98|nr:ABC transporter ATP-binding protein [Anaeromyxobacter sp. PSR-1]GAO04829.1 putative ABC transporter ATP-binding protein [Anaeromyxobacter sp. PSR-1]